MKILVLILLIILVLASIAGLVCLTYGIANAVTEEELQNYNKYDRKETKNKKAN